MSTVLEMIKEKNLTVEQANKVYLEYFAEGSPKAADIRALIISAKAHIRAMYPDEVTA